MVPRREEHTAKDASFFTNMYKAVTSHHSHDYGDEAGRNVFRLRRLAIASPPSMPPEYYAAGGDGQKPAS